MKIELDKMKSEMRTIYESLWINENRIPGDICKTYNKGRYAGESNNSYSFVIPNIDNKDLTKENIKEISEQLIKLFKIEDQELFKNKLEEVCSGSGDEARKITTLHSSSLCALLFFYNVKNHPMTLKLNNKNITFNDVMFEVKNKVTEDGGPSNMDVVLINKEEKVILFLESKFTEYLSSGNEDVRYAYKKEFGKEIYNEEFLSKLGLTFIKKEKSDENYMWIKTNKEGKKEEFFTIGVKPEQSTIYIEGIKQMISHFIGVRNFTKSGIYEYESRFLDNSYSVYLGEILFDKFNFEKANESLKKYTNCYSNLIKELNTLDHNFTLLEEPLKYSSLENYCEPKIRNFYFGD